MVLAFHQAASLHCRFAVSIGDSNNSTVIHFEKIKFIRPQADEQVCKPVAMFSNGHQAISAFKDFKIPETCWDATSKAVSREFRSEDDIVRPLPKLTVRHWSIPHDKHKLPGSGANCLAKASAFSGANCHKVQPPNKSRATIARNNARWFFCFKIYFSVR